MTPPVTPLLGPVERLTAADLIRVVGAVHVVVTLFVFSNALAVGAGELVGRAADCSEVEGRGSGWS